jgi:hypothetical protein
MQHNDRLIDVKVFESSKTQKSFHQLKTYVKLGFILEYAKNTQGEFVARALRLKPCTLHLEPWTYPQAITPFQ